MIDKVDGNRIGIDNNIYAIEALKLIRDKAYLLPKTNYVKMKNLKKMF